LAVRHGSERDGRRRSGGEHPLDVHAPGLRPGRAFGREPGLANAGHAGDHNPVCRVGAQRAVNQFEFFPPANERPTG
jgi:hypothetical protein